MQFELACYAALALFILPMLHWPAFRRVDFLRALRAYAARQRRFGA